MTARPTTPRRLRCRGGGRGAPAPVPPRAGRHAPPALATLLCAIRAAPCLDVICGSRFLDAGHRYPAPISRRTGIHLFAFVLTRILGQPISDPTSGFRLYNRRAIA